MLRYEVTVAGPRGASGIGFEKYFNRQSTSPEILATGCFLDIRFERGDAGAYRPLSLSTAATRADLDRYPPRPARRRGFRADFRDRTSLMGSRPHPRENWTELKAYGLTSLTRELTG